MVKFTIGMIQIMLVGAKIFGFTDISWLVVFAPVIVMASIGGLALLFLAIIGIILEALSK